MASQVIRHEARLGNDASSSLVLRVHLPAMLLGVYVTLPFYKPAVQPWFPIDLTLILAALCAAVSVPTVVRIVFSEDPDFATQRRFLYLWSGLPLLILLGVLTSPDQSSAIADAATHLGTLAAPLLLVLVVVRERGSIAQYLYVLFVVGVSVTIGGLISDVTVGRADRVVVFGANPINVSIAAMLLPMVGLSFLWKKFPWIRLMVALLSLGALWVAAVSARGPIVAAALAFLVLNIFRSVRSAILVTIASTVVLMGLPTALESFLPEAAGRRFSSLINSITSIFAGDDLQGVDANVGSRLQLYEIAMDMFQESPLLGNGLGSFHDRVQSIPPLAHLGYPHNIVLEYGATFGIVGLVWLFMIITRSIRTALSRHHDPLILTLGVLFLSSLFEAMVSGGLDNRLLWAGVFLLIALPATDEDLQIQVSEPGTESGGRTIKLHLESNRSM